MMRLWHNPRCSKSRAALALLEEAGHQPEVFRYLDTPPDAGTLAALLEKAGLTAAALVRRGEAAWKESGLSADSPEAEIRTAILEHPILIERPILETETTAIVGRPPERVLEII
ncbi:MAG: arsenate reductase (glutaredoxin) [Pseudomonadota bacterium]